MIDGAARRMGAGRDGDGGRGGAMLRRWHWNDIDRLTGRGR